MVPFLRRSLKVLPSLLVVAMLVLTATLQFSDTFPPKAFAADNVITDITVQDSDGNGTIDRLQVTIDNDSTNTAASHDTSGWSVTDDGNAVTVNTVTFSSATNADPLVIFVNLDTADPDLDNNDTTANTIELIYVQQGVDAGFEYDNAGDVQLQAIATGDTGATDTENDGAAPVVQSAITEDTNGNGKLDHLELQFTEAIDDSSISNYNAGTNYTPTSLALAVVSGEAVQATEGTCANDAAEDDAFLCISFTEDAGTCDGTSQAGCDTEEVDQDVTWTGASVTIDDLAAGTNNAADLLSGDVVEADSAEPSLMGVTLSLTSNRNRLAFVYSEPITTTDGASTATKGDLTTAGTVAGLGSFATAGNTQVNTTLNTVGGNGTATITVDLADQAAGFLQTASSTEPSGVFTPVSNASFVDGAGLQVDTTNTPTATGGGSWDLTKPTLTSITVSDNANNDGEIDRAVLVFNSNMRDSNITNGDGNLGAGGTTTGAFTTGTPDDTTTTFDRTVDDNGVNTAASAGDFTYSGATTLITDLAGNLLDTATDGQIATGDAAEVDAANPIVTAVALSLTGNRNRISVTYSENMTVTDGASTATKGDTTTAGTVVGFGSFGTTGNTTVATTDNTVGGNGTSTLFIDLADQAGAFLVGTSTTEPSGTFTPVASAEVTDGTNQVNTGNTPAATGGGSWDLTKPTLTTITVSDNAGANGRIDRAVLVFNSAMRASNFTNGNGALGAAGTTTGTFTDLGDDTNATFDRTADDNNVDTTTTAGDFTYSGATTSLTDLAGNLLDTATDGQIATGDNVETDGAQPVVLTAVNSVASNRNRTTFTFSENMTCTDGASTATKADLTAAGTIVGLGTFATAGNTTVSTTFNTLGGCGSSTLTVDFANEAGGFFNSASTTEFSGVFTPATSAEFDDAAGNTLNTAGTPTLTGGGSWDLTKPTLTSITVSDSAGNNGRIDRAVLVFNSNMRDSNFTNGNGALGTAGSPAGTFTTGTPDDTTTTFNRTADDNNVDTSTAAGDFTYSAATTPITDLAGNLVDTATDGQIATGDAVEVDAANPIVVSATLSLTGDRNRLSLAYSENMTVTNGASTATKGDTTTAGTVAGFGSFGTTGNVQVNTTLNTVGGNGTSTLFIDLADQAGGFLLGTSTTEPSGNFTPVASAEVTDGTNQVNTANTPAAAGGGSWDLTKPTLTTITVSDSAGANGRIDRAVLVFNSNMRDSNFTNGDGALGTAGSPAGTFTTGTPDDTTTTFDRTADDNNVDTTTAAGDFTYSGATTSLTDLAGNLLDTATDGQIATGDNAETDGASPILTAIALSDTGTRNRLSFTYSENVNVTNGASTATKGDTTTAGTVAGFGSFATTGNVTVATTLNTVGGNGTSTLTLDFADQANSFLANGSTTEPSGVFTPVASAEITDGTNQVNTGNTPAATGGGSWDLTAPTVNNTWSCDTDLDADINRIQVDFSENMRDQNLSQTNFEGDNDGTNDGVGEEVPNAFATDTQGCDGNANDADSDDDKARFDFATGIAGTDAAFLHNVTLSASDIHGNLLAVGDGLGTENDRAVPIQTGNIIYTDADNNGTVDRVDITYTEAVTYVYQDTDWTPVVNGLTGFDVTACTACTAVTTLQLTATADPNLTGVSGGAEPTLAYTAGNNIADAGANNAANLGATGLVDNAAAIIVSRLTKDTDQADGSAGATDNTLDGILATFTEGMDASTVAVTDFIIQTQTPSALTEAYADVTDDTDLFFQCTDCPVGDTANVLQLQITGGDGIQDLSGFSAFTEPAAVPAGVGVSSGSGRSRRSGALAVCSDGIIQPTNDEGISEQCDDGNRVSGDGCSSICQIEPGFSATTGTGGGASTPVDYCASAPCQNGGQCISGETTYSCICLSGYEGKNCETVMEVPVPITRTTPLKTDITTDVLSDRNKVRELRNSLRDAFGENLHLSGTVGSVSEGTIEGKGDAQLVNPFLNAVTEGLTLPEMEVIRSVGNIQVNFSHEAKLLRPMYLVIKDIGETDVSRVRIIDTNGLVVTSFNLSSEGVLTIFTNYLRNFTISIDDMPPVSVMPDILEHLEKDAIMFLVKQKIISGYPDGTFKPENFLIRAETAKLIALLNGVHPDNQKEFDKWYDALLRALVDAGILQGHVAPDSIELRANFLALIAKSLGVNISALPACKVQIFDDVPIDIWYCPLVQYALFNGWIRESSGNFRPSDGLTRGVATGWLSRAFGKTPAINHGLGGPSTDTTEKVCSCENGVAATGDSCTSDGAEICSSCNDGYDLSGGTCKAKATPASQEDNRKVYFVSECFNLSEWEKSAIYTKGMKVMYNNEMWEANWWNTSQYWDGNTPGKSGAWKKVQSCDGSKKLIEGLLCSGAKKWDDSAIFQTEDKTVHKDHVYTAQHWTQGDEPDRTVWQSQWEYVGTCLDE